MMSNASIAQHTQGPWKWLDYPDGRKLLAAPACAVIHCPDAPITIAPADQALIAAAPEMLAALRKAVQTIEALHGLRERIYRAALQQLRAEEIAS